MNEEWRAVPGYPGYEVSDHGRVRSLDRIVNCGRGKGIRRGRMMANYIGYAGYPVVPISVNGKVTRFRVYRLVLLAFVGPRLPGMTGSHLNGVRTDTRLANLRWESHRDNNARKRDHGTQPVGEKHRNSKLSMKAVREIRAAHSSGASFKRLGREYGVNPSTVERAVKGETWAHIA